MKPWRSSDYTVAHILFVHGSQQGLYVPVVTVDDCNQIGVLRAGCADAIDDNVGDLVAMIGRVEPSLDPDRCAAIDLDAARYDDPFPIGLAP